MFNRLTAWMKGATPGTRLPWRMFWVAFVVRVLYITLARSYHVRLLEDHFQFGWEIGRIARALVTGYGYADPFTGHTGPTAWSPPLYPLLLAAVFKICGVYTPLAAWTILTINSIFSAAIAPAVYEIAVRCFGDANKSVSPNRDVALWSGWLWALYPAAIQYAVHWIWEMSVTTCLFAWVLVIALRVRGVGGKANSSSSLWVIFSVLWALIFLSNSTLVLFLPVCGLWMLRYTSISKALPKAVLACAIFVACVAPWVYRNQVVFRAFIPSRGNFGAELYQSMLPENDGFPWGTTVPYFDADPEYRSYKALGELAYVREKNDLAHALIREHPERFAGYALKRVWFYWVSVPHPIEHGLTGWVLEIVREMDFSFLSVAGLMGLALSIYRRVPASWLFVWAFLLLPLPYYFITSGARFRHPLEPLITIFTVYLFQSTTPLTMRTSL